MSALASLQNIGKKLVALFGEPSSGENGCGHDIFAHDALSDVLPYHSYDPEHGLFLGKNSVGFTLESVPLIGADDTCQNEILSLFQEVMEEGSSIQCLLWADHRVSSFLDHWENARSGAKDIYREIAKRRTVHFKTSKVVSPRIFRFILSYSVEDSECTPHRLQEIKEIKGRILKTLGSLTYTRAWDAHDFMHALDGLVNFRLSPDVKVRRWNECETLASQLPAGGVLRVDEDQIEWKGEPDAACKSYRVTDFPESWSLAAMQLLIGDLYRDSFRLTSPFLIHYGVHCPSQEQAASQFRKKMHLIENQGKSGALCRLIPDLAEELSEYDFVRRSTHQSNRFVWTQLGAAVWSEKATIQNAGQALKSLFRINQFTLAENSSLHLPHYLSFLPMSWAEYVDDFKRLNLLKTTIATECGNLVPLQGEWLGTPSPGVLLVGRRGQLLNWNPFDNRSGNYNVVVVGRSGSGKSVFMQDLILNSLGVGTRVFVLEVGRSFEKMCNVADGQQIEFSNENTLCINPFTHISDEDPEARDQSLGMLKAIISSMAAPVDGTSDFERALIEKAITAAWKKKNSKATVTDVADWLQSQNDERAKTLAVMLTPYCSGGVHARYFEGKNNVDFTSPLVLVELEELKEKKDLQSVVLQMFIMTITNQIFLGDRKTPFHICIDEAWDLLRGKQTGEFIETLARRLRKYNGSLVIGTQSVDDFYTTPGALAAFENSDWMCMLSQKKSSIQRFADSGRVEMDEAKKTALESLTTRHGEFSEVMICDAEGNYSIGRLILDSFSNLLYTTKADEYSEVMELRKSGLSVCEAIDQVLRSSNE